MMVDHELRVVVWNRQDRYTCCNYHLWLHPRSLWVQLQVIVPHSNLYKFLNGPCIGSDVIFVNFPEGVERIRIQFSEPAIRFLAVSGVTAS